MPKMVNFAECFISRSQYNPIQIPTYTLIMRTITSARRIDGW